MLWCAPRKTRSCAGRARRPGRAPRWRPTRAPAARRRDRRDQGAGRRAASGTARMAAGATRPRGAPGAGARRPRRPRALDASPRSVTARVPARRLGRRRAALDARRAGCASSDAHDRPQHDPRVAAPGHGRSRELTRVVGRRRPDRRRARPTAPTCEDSAVTTYATLHTNQGDIRIELFPNHAPKTVRNFVGLADGRRSGPTRRPAQKRAATRSTTASSSTGSSPAS